MKIKSAGLSALLAIFAAGTAHATLIDFEDTGSPGMYVSSAAGNGQYGGFASNGFYFTNSGVIDLTVPGWGAGIGGAHSGNYSGFEAFGAPMVMSKLDNSTFSIQDLWIGGWQGASETLTILGLANAKVVASVTFSGNGSWQDVSLNFSQVNGVLFSGGDFLVDDVTVDSGNSVPEPATLALLCTGLLGLAASRRST